MKSSLHHYLVLIMVAGVFLARCVGPCDITQSYTWSNTINSNPPQQMLDELTSILNVANCNANLNTTCNANDINYSERIWGVDLTDATKNNLIIWSSPLIPFSNQTPSTTLSVSELESIRDNAIILAKQSAPYCACQSYDGRISDIVVNGIDIPDPPQSNTIRRILYLTVTYNCCGQCA